MDGSSEKQESGKKTSENLPRDQPHGFLGEGSRGGKNGLTRAPPVHTLRGCLRRGAANPATPQLEGKPPKGLREVVVRKLDSSSLRAFAEETGLARAVSRKWRRETIARTRDWLIFSPTDRKRRRIPRHQICEGELRKLSGIRGSA